MTRSTVDKNLRNNATSPSSVPSLCDGTYNGLHIRGRLKVLGRFLSTGATNHRCILTRPVLIVATGLGFATRPRCPVVPSLFRPTVTNRYCTAKRGAVSNTVNVVCRLGRLCCTVAWVTELVSGMGTRRHWPRPRRDIDTSRDLDHNPG